MPRFAFELLATDASTGARRGRLYTPHGTVETPCFMPVGTRASVKAVAQEALEALGAEIILANAYHLYLRPGHALIRELGGLHAFAAWPHPILTDSGGFQVFSLGAGKRQAALNRTSALGPAPVKRSTGTGLPGPRAGASSRPAQFERWRLISGTPAVPARRSSSRGRAGGLGPAPVIDEDGVTFRSHLDGSQHHFTPELAMEIQLALGADIIMAFDDCTPYPASEAQARASLERTQRWALRCRAAWAASPHSGASALFGIVQGGMHAALRREAAEQIVTLDLPGYAIGGVSVGEPRELSYEMVAAAVAELPADRPRYLMGVGTPQELVRYASLGIDMMDCVLPTRNARNGLLFTSQGPIAIKHARYASDPGPLDPACTCRVCARYSRAYLRHLFQSGEPLAGQLHTHHNLFHYLDTMRQLRHAIELGRFGAWCKDRLGQATPEWSYNRSNPSEW